MQKLQRKVYDALQDTPILNRAQVQWTVHRQKCDRRATTSPKENIHLLSHWLPPVGNTNCWQESKVTDSLPSYQCVSKTKDLPQKRYKNSLILSQPILFLKFTRLSELKCAKLEWGRDNLYMNPALSKSEQLKPF